MRFPAIFRGRPAAEPIVCTNPLSFAEGPCGKTAQMHISEGFYRWFFLSSPVNSEP